MPALITGGQKVEWENITIFFETDIFCGQARISIARTAYAGSDIALLDDCLSAVDAQVSQAILKNCLLTGPLATKTRILVTHALHFLDRTDYIYVMEDGNVAEHGTYKVNDKRERTILPLTKLVLSNSWRIAKYSHVSCRNMGILKNRRLHHSPKKLPQ